jgi:putative effector of murein hydrolase
LLPERFAADHRACQGCWPDAYTDYAARGFAVGLASHGIGTARAFAVDEIAGTFAGIAMGLNGVATSLILPLLLRWL